MTVALNSTQTVETAESWLARHAQEIATGLTEEQFRRNTNWEARYGEQGKVRCTEDALYHLEYLLASSRAGRPALFLEYAAWAKSLLAGLGIAEKDLAQHLDLLAAQLEKRMPRGLCAGPMAILREAIEALPGMPVGVPSYLSADNPLLSLARAYLQALLRADRASACGMIMEAAEGGTQLRDLYLHVFQATQREIGRLWQLNEISVAKEHFCTAVTQLAISQLYPRLFGAERKGRTIVATCVSGDLHELGVRMVADFFEIDGWDSYYLGADTPLESIVREVAERKADVVAVSATLTLRVDAVGDLIEALRKAQAVDSRPCRVLVGGYPFNIVSDLWKQVGADGHAIDAEQAVNLANNLVHMGRAGP